MTERAKYWSGLVAAWAGSGLSQAEFCRRRGIHGGTFAWWKRQLRRADAGAVPGVAATSGPSKRQARPSRRAPARFVEVRLSGASSAWMYEVVLAGGRSIRVPAQFDPRVLGQLIAAVESC